MSAVRNRAAPYPPSHYCLKPEELERLGFPGAGDTGVVAVGQATGVDGAVGQDGTGEHLLGIDCEMVITSEGRELARVTVVDQALKTVYDSLVVRSARSHDTRRRRPCTHGCRS